MKPTRRELLTAAAAAPLAAAAASSVAPAPARAAASRRRRPASSTTTTTQPAPVQNILMVIDGGPGGRLHSTFGPGIVPADDMTSGDWFGFSEVVRVLGALPGYRLTRAHRDVDPGGPLGWDGDRARFRPDVERFRFDAVDLSAFGQIWLFGIGAPADTAPLLDSEVAAIAEFMDGGGGVFATGDHADIGASMCGRIPRVRSMRTWFVKNPPDNEPRAPDPIDAQRLDTTVWGAEETRGSADFRFNNQSDDRPAAITPTPAGRVHPLLDLGRGRRLEHLPDHMHEGAVIDPFDPAMRMSRTWTVAGRAIDEYPTAPDGSQPRPQVLALGTTFGGHTTISHEVWHIGSNVATAPGDRTHGVIGAYDGRTASVGRVVVTSTFHQFADVNIIGDPRAVTPTGAVDPVRRLGFRASVAGLAHLGTQRAWWGVIARWLNRPVPPR